MGKFQSAILCLELQFIKALSLFQMKRNNEDKYRKKMKKKILENGTHEKIN